jgi:hypothetical protein
MSAHGRPFSIDESVRVYPGTGHENHGVVVEDFGALAGHGVEIGGKSIVGPARRWAVRLDAGDLVFVDTYQLAPE